MDLDTKQKETWSDFINRRFLIEQNKVGKKLWAKDVAKLWGVSEATLSRWLRGDFPPPEDDLLRKVGAVLGPEAYIAAGREPMMPDNPRAKRIVDRISDLPDEYQEIFANMIEEAANRAVQAQPIPRPGFFQIPATQTA